MKGQKVWINTEKFGIEEVLKEGEDKKYIFSGLALPFNKASRNRNTYNQKRAVEVMESLNNVSFLFNHDVNKVLGHTIEVSEEKDGIHYKADIDPEEKEFIRKAKRKDIRNVSVGVIVDEVVEKEGQLPDFFIKEFVELSAVTTPGFPDTTLHPNEFMSIESFIENKEWRKQEPFAGYKDFDDCVRKNQDKKDPEAYCAVIQRKAEPKKHNLEINKYSEANIYMADDKEQEPENKDDEEQEALVEGMKESLVKVTERVDKLEERIATLEASLKKTNDEQEKLIEDNKRVEKSIIENQGVEQKTEFTKEGLYKAMGVEL
jgi:HK97 family phage prohead protease